MRELAQIYLIQDRHSEAESYARLAFDVAPTNPFIIDIICSVIIGKSDRQELAQNEEIRRLLDELRTSSDRNHDSFYETKMALFFSRLGDCADALDFARRAVEKTPRRFGVYVSQALIKIQCGHVDDIAGNIEAMRRLADDKRTGEGKSARFQIARIEILAAAEKRQFTAARALLFKSIDMPRRVSADVEAWLAQKVLENKQEADEDSLIWATNVSRKIGEAR